MTQIRPFAIAMRVGSFWLPLIDIAQDRLEVDDRRSIDRLQAADLYAYPVEAQDSNAVQADRVGSARGPSAEDTLLRSGQVPSRMDGQDRRSASCNQVSTMISSPTAMPSRPAWTSEAKIRYAGGAPSSPWRGASAVDVSGLFTCPIGRIVKVDESAMHGTQSQLHMCR